MKWFTPPTGFDLLARKLLARRAGLRNAFGDSAAGERKLKVDVTFESRRLYVAPRKSVLFFARAGGERVRCYVKEDALVDLGRGLREETDLYQRCLLVFDQHRAAIQAAAARLIEAKVRESDGAVVVSRTALALETQPPLEALNADR